MLIEFSYSGLLGLVLIMVSEFIFPFLVCLGFYGMGSVPKSGRNPVCPLSNHFPWMSLWGSNQKKKKKKKHDFFSLAIITDTTLRNKRKEKYGVLIIQNKHMVSSLVGV